ncbi:MAG: copper homeostasis protein CutC [Erysipelotrichaceae bacterium]
MIVEVCLEHYDDVLKAVEAGVKRIELNSALSIGGLTPSRTLLRKIRNLDVKVIVMIRLRANDFVFSADEIDLMYEEAKDFLEQGADGIAFGALTLERRIDSVVMKRFSNLCKEVGKEFVCHRAIDQSSSYFDDIEALIECGVTRVLTSGGATTALDGAPLLKKAQQRFANRIEILPGCGINKENIVQIVNETGCTQVHGTFSKKANLHYEAPVSFAEYKDGLRRLFDVEHYLSVVKRLDDCNK